MALSYGNANGNLTHGPAVAKVTAAAVPMAAAAPTKAEYDALATRHNEMVTKFNTLLEACKSANIVA